jgi:hypothetical protein
VVAVVDAELLIVSLGVVVGVALADVEADVSVAGVVLDVLSLVAVDAGLVFVLDVPLVPSFETGMRRCERARLLDMREPLMLPLLMLPLLMLPPLMELEPAEPLTPFAPLLFDEPLRFEPEVLLRSTSPDERFMLVPWPALPVLGAHELALIPLVVDPLLALPAARFVPDVVPLADAELLRRPVVVVSAPTPFAPLVALRPVNRVSGLVDVLFGVVLDGTPAVLPASVGVPFTPVVAAPVAAPDVLDVPVVPAPVLPLALMLPVGLVLPVVP